jgi:hypothetical protein
MWTPSRRPAFFLPGARQAIKARWIGDLAALPWIFEFLEMLKPLNNLVVGTISLRMSICHGGPSRESKDLHRFSILSACHLQIHAIALIPSSLWVDLFRPPNSMAGL